MKDKNDNDRRVYASPLSDKKFIIFNGMHLSVCPGWERI